MALVLNRQVGLRSHFTDSPLSSSPSTSARFSLWLLILAVDRRQWPSTLPQPHQASPNSVSKLKPWAQTVRGVPRPLGRWQFPVQRWRPSSLSIGYHFTHPAANGHVLGGMLMPIQPKPCNLATEAQRRQPPGFSNTTSQHLAVSPRETLGCL